MDRTEELPDPEQLLRGLEEAHQALDRASGALRGAQELLGLATLQQTQAAQRLAELYQAHTALL